MPNYDAGHYFLTALAPVRLDSILIGGQSHSRRHLIRDVLADMPTGERTVATQHKPRDNPFARNTRTHFARFVVLDDVVFNGRIAGDALVAQARRTNFLTPQPIDRLSTPFLIFVADFDAESGAENELDAYLAAQWATMSAELIRIFQNCVGFDTVTTADDFIRYIKRCQIETTMPFNDYWSEPRALPDAHLLPYLIGAAAAALLAVAGIVMAKAWLFIVGLLALALAAVQAYRKVMDVARIPFPKSPPPAPSSDLPTILKALHVQRAFTDFAIHAQGMSDQALYDGFGIFIADNKPNDIGEPTQLPGIIGT